MKTALVMVHYGSLNNTKRSLQSLKDKLTGNSCYLINNTSDNLSALAKIFPGTILINNSTNLGFARSVNQGIKRAINEGCDAVLLLNNDLAWTSGTLLQLTRLLNSDPSIAVVTPLLKHSRGYDWGGQLSRWTGLVNHRNWPNPPKTAQKVAHVAAAAMLIKTKALEQVGYFDERYFMYYEDVDLCLRLIQASYQLRINPEVVITHAVSAGSSLLTRTLHQWRSHLLFVTKHLGRTIYPTAYLFDLFLYPLYLLKSLISRA